MTKDTLLDIYAAPEIYVDAFTEHVTRDGVMTCVGYRRLTEGRVIVVRLVWPAVNTEAAIDDAHAAMNEAERLARDPVSIGARKKHH